MPLFDSSGNPRGNNVGTDSLEMSEDKWVYEAGDHFDSWIFVDLLEFLN